MKYRWHRSLIRSLGAALSVCACVAVSSAQQLAYYSNPVIAGDYPDPSIIRVGQDYWATTTSGTWEPEFPILHSRDLVNWENVGAVFNHRPQWAAADFWAPEISEDGGRYFVYYTARKKDGPLCVAVATAEAPPGPYTDRGPLVCQKDGSIDPMAVRDDKGDKYLVWKEDGNSRNLPTVIWAQKLSNNGTMLLGERKELIRNDVPWEGNVVEAPFILHHDGWFYLFYAGNACCGRKCNYAEGVARSRTLIGHWEKNPVNPILAENETWQCPGHGSIVEDRQGRDFFLYHSYRKSAEAFFIGREAMLDQVQWNENGWPSINNGKGPSARAISPFGVIGRHDDYSFFDNFSSSRLSPGWQWRQSHEPVILLEQKSGINRLILTAANRKRSDKQISAVLTQPTRGSNYTATTLLDATGMKPGSQAGISAYEDENNSLGVTFGDGKIELFVRQNKKHETISTVDAASATLIYLRISVTEADRFRFSFSTDNREWKQVGEEVDGSYLEAVRIALTAGGVQGATGKFGWIRITPVR